jgi:pyruvate/2-oxoglutarate/acetoin dehydrogenase E1 component
MMRKITFANAINEALFQSMELSQDVIVLGQSVDNKSGIFGTTTGLHDEFGSDRVQDFPNAENIMTSTATGSALAGLRPVIIHQRLDFMIYSLDVIVNWMSLWRFKSNGKSGLPVTIRAIVGKGWGQGPQHSKSLHAWFAHLPGIKVAIPSTAYDAKGLLLESIFGEDPSIIIENRSLFSMKDNVPEAPYRVRFGKSIKRRNGNDLTLVAIGDMVPLALRVAEYFKDNNFDIEVIDLRSASPLDHKSIIDSVTKTKRLAIADPAWKSVGLASEIITFVYESLGSEMKSNPIRICLPDSHTPVASSLESKYYPNEEIFISSINKLINN